MQKCVKPPLLISECLLGKRCRYDGGTKGDPRVSALSERYTLLPVCPEELGGLPTPRPPAEIRGERVISSAGADVTEQFALGAQKALALCRAHDCKLALLKARSPSCGAGRVYDGTFSGKVVPGDGVTARLLKQNGVTVYTEEDFPF